jgi:hypothetical protein
MFFKKRKTDRIFSSPATSHSLNSRPITSEKVSPQAFRKTSSFPLPTLLGQKKKSLPVELNCNCNSIFSLNATTLHTRKKKKKKKNRRDSN